MDDFNTEHLTIVQTRIAKAIVKRLGADADGGGCQAFYSPKQWAARGEEYGLKASLIVVHDGGAAAPYFNMDYCDYKNQEQMIEALSKIGYWAEQCTSWYTAIYEDE